jgi:DHA1 family multidrug resistance protein-like MFS transporter
VSTFQFIAVGLVFAIGTMVSSPVTFELVPTFARREWLGAYYGFNGYALAIGGGLSASLGGFTYDLGAKLGLPLLPWWVCLFTGIAVFSGLFLFERRRALALARAQATGSEGEFCPVQVGAR